MSGATSIRGRNADLIWKHTRATDKGSHSGFQIDDSSDTPQDPPFRELHHISDRIHNEGRQDNDKREKARNM